MNEQDSGSVDIFSDIEEEMNGNVGIFSDIEEEANEGIVLFSDVEEEASRIIVFSYVEKAACSNSDVISDVAPFRTVFKSRALKARSTSPLAFSTLVA